jgi:ribosomal protein S1
MHSDMLSQISNPKEAYIAKIYSRNEGGFFCKINGIECYMPGSLAAANKINNFDEMLGNEVIVMIEDFVKQTNIFIVSHKKYIN